MAEMRSDGFQTAQEQLCDLSGTQTFPIHSNGKCSYCETMYKNLQYLEDYLRRNTAKNSCNSCSTCLSFLLYMKQQTIPVPKFDSTNEVVYRTMLPSEVMPTCSSECETVQEAIKYQSVPNVGCPLTEKKSHALEKQQLKSFSTDSRRKIPSKALLSATASNKQEKPRLLATKGSVVSGKKKLKPSLSKGISAKTTSKRSASVMKKSTSNLSRASTGSKSRNKKQPTVKSSLSKAASSKATTVKHTAKSRAVWKKTKTIA